MGGFFDHLASSARRALGDPLPAGMRRRPGPPGSMTAEDDGPLEEILEETALADAPRGPRVEPTVPGTGAGFPPAPVRPGPVPMAGAGGERRAGGGSAGRGARRGAAGTRIAPGRIVRERAGDVLSLRARRPATPIRCDHRRPRPCRRPRARRRLRSPPGRRR